MSESSSAPTGETPFELMRAPTSSAAGEVPSQGDFIQVDRLYRSYPGRRGIFGRSRRVHAVCGVSFGVEKGGTFGLVGESGSGKSTIAKVLLGVEPASDGTASVDGIRLNALNRTTTTRLHRTLQPVLQDPYGALSPLMRIEDIVDEPMRAQGQHRGTARAARLRSLIETVGLDSNVLRRYPHELSGGQRQRVAIARALASEPQALILDEPVSALDVSVQAQILNLLKDLQALHQLTYVLISHDLAVVAYMSTRIGVLYLGEFMELGTRDDVVRRARHPYTQALIASSEIDLDASPEKEGALQSASAVSATGEPVSGAANRAENGAKTRAKTGADKGAVAVGCRFEARCRFALPRCLHEVPQLRAVSKTHWIACHFDLPPIDAVSNDAAESRVCNLS